MALKLNALAALKAGMKTEDAGSEENPAPVVPAENAPLEVGARVKAMDPHGSELGKVVEVLEDKYAYKCEMDDGSSHVYTAGSIEKSEDAGAVSARKGRTPASVLKALDLPESATDTEAVAKAQVLRADAAEGRQASKDATRIQTTMAEQSAKLTAKDTEIATLKTEMAKMDAEALQTELRMAHANEDAIDDLADIVRGKYKTEGVSWRQAVAAHKVKSPSSYQNVVKLPVDDTKQSPLTDLEASATKTPDLALKDNSPRQFSFRR